MRRPRRAEGGVGEHRADQTGIESSGPVVGHRGGLERKPSNRGDQRDQAGDEREPAYDRRQRERQPFRRISPKICAHAAGQHRRHEMGEAAKGESGHGRTRSARRGRSRSSRPTQAFSIRANRCSRPRPNPTLHIFMPFMAPPAPPVPAAPIPITLNSTSTGPACSKLSIALTLSPLVRGWVKCVNIK